MRSSPPSLPRPNQSPTATTEAPPANAVALAASHGIELRATVHNGLQNVGIVAAFMTALAGQIYSNVPQLDAGNSGCFGAVAVQVMLTLEWFAMGCFFATIGMSIVLALDIDGVPDRMLPLHLRQTSFCFALPYAFTALGMVLMPAGYGIDLGERTGSCYFTIIGCISCSLFPVFVLVVLIWLRRKRKQLSFVNDVKAGRQEVSPPNRDQNHDIRLGKSVWTPYLDLIPSTAWLQQHHRRE